MYDDERSRSEEYTVEGGQSVRVCVEKKIVCVCEEGERER